MGPDLLIAIYCGAVIVASLAGGYVPLLVKLTHRRMQLAISFVSGIILGIGLLHLVPHGFLAVGSIDRTMLWVLAGFLFMFFLERFFSFHHHDVEDEPHEHDHDHAGREHAPAVSSTSWAGAAVGLSLHSLIDGVAIAAAVQSGASEGGLRWAGLGTALAVALHKPFDALTIGTLLAAAGESVPRRRLLNFLYALITPLGAFLCFWLTSSVAEPHLAVGEVLCFAGGAFVCIATSDLLPELQFHRHDRVGLSLALLAGIALAWGAVMLEGHDHEHGEAPHVENHTHSR